MYSLLHILFYFMKTNNQIYVNLIYDQLSLKAIIVLLYRSSDGITFLCIVIYFFNKLQLLLIYKPPNKKIVYLKLIISAIPVNKISLKASIVFFYQIFRSLNLLVVLFHTLTLDKSLLNPLMSFINILIYSDITLQYYCNNPYPLITNDFSLVLYCDFNTSKLQKIFCLILNVVYNYIFFIYFIFFMHIMPFTMNLMLIVFMYSTKESNLIYFTKIYCGG